MHDPGHGRRRQDRQGGDQGAGRARRAGACLGPKSCARSRPEDHRCRRGRRRAMDDTHALSRAMQGADAIYHICPNVSPHEIAFARPLIAAATDAEVARLVYHSVLHPQIEAMPHHWNKLRVEEMLFGSKLDVTILQPTAYMQNSLAEWDRMARRHLSRALSDRDPAQPGRSRRCRRSRGDGADQRRPFRAPPTNWSARRR